MNANVNVNVREISRGCGGCGCDCGDDCGDCCCGVGGCVLVRESAIFRVNAARCFAALFVAPRFFLPVSVPFLSLVVVVVVVVVVVPVVAAGFVELLPFAQISVVVVQQGRYLVFFPCFRGLFVHSNGPAACLRKSVLLD